MKSALLALPLLLHPVAVCAQQLVPPEVVRLENVKIDDDMKTVYVGNTNKHFVLYCDIKADGCITPEANKNYLLFDANTRWKMPGAKDFITLAFVQDYTVKYNKGENIGLVPQDAKSGDLGMFLLDKTGGGYEADTVFTDGPIIYGTGMNDEDRQKAWKHFFMQIVEAVIKQQGADALVKLARRCLPNQDFCTQSLDANLVGIGGIQEPRKVVVIVATDVHDQNKQIERIVCTWPMKGKKVCRDWSTGKLITGQNVGGD
jgi:hypothetical protein